MLYKITRLIAILFFKIIFRIEVRGRQHIPQKGEFILAGNHTSYLDPVALAVACPRQLNFMARDDLFKLPIFGWFIRRVGAFPIKRDSIDIAHIREALRRLNKGAGLVIFPEGGRSSNGLLKKIEYGAGFLAVKSNASIIPAYLFGTEQALPINAHFIRPVKIKVYFGQKIEIQRDGDYREITERVLEELHRLHNQGLIGGEGLK
ncbi:MAG: 1-acyl-sn-glycerol-3-phosphate acyltransferase [Candidatus Omnitrophica bacterium]|nr:1-acyl-sn-glycerol-3-phosphate acyltransferase [Candidatus Omnitrophota bacterium]